MGHKRNKAEKRVFYKQKQKQKRKEIKEHSREKRARLIIKNLPFKATEEAIKEHFEKFGQISEVKLLKRPDGKLVGCGFVQYVAVQNAAKARHHLNGKEFMGREIECDFALSKDRYLKKEKKEEEVKIKEEPIDLDDSVVKIEDGVEIKVESDVEQKTEEEKSDDDDEEKVSVDEENSESDEDDEEDADEKKNIKVEENRPRVISNDVSEGKTVFIKNIPFETTNDDLRECMQQFGPIYYALICMDRLTEHSKGTGFVKFRNKEDAEKCLQAGTELKLLDNILDCHPALNRTEIQKQSQEKNDKKKTDSRNLYLVKEGVILAGSKAAEGVSATDMAKRLQLEQYKTQMLRNLNMFVSRNRLAVHNLPPGWDDAKLRELLKKHAGKKSVIKEAKVMRDLRNVDSTGLGKSKEYGFVTFTSHEHALNALRSLNNNPNIFTPAKRPVVAFSIENRVMIKAKEKRLERSRQRNPLSKDFDPNSKPKPDAPTEVVESKKFTGVAATPGVQKMRSRHNLKTQAKLHRDNLKVAKRKKKAVKERNQELIKQPKQKQNVKMGVVDNFSQMVNDYKRKLTSAISNNKDSKKAKWYE